ncbi:MAG: alanine:cation symporter family protein, partial [Gammaproteobacteria bacterium]|nr:alanine:cation symporter family protein [Gammaproteobacteria bacterium]
SAAIAHAAAKTEYPVREGLVAGLGPFIDTVIVCTITGLVIVITGAYAEPQFAALDGAALTSAAFGSVLGWFPYLLVLASLLFAYSTMIAWSYYGERCWVWLVGDSLIIGYRILFCGCVLIGTVASLGPILDLSDMMVLSMAFPNVLGLYMLSNHVRRALDQYWQIPREIPPKLKRRLG